MGNKIGIFIMTTVALAACAVDGGTVEEAGAKSPVVQQGRAPAVSPMRSVVLARATGRDATIDRAEQTLVVLLDRPSVAALQTAAGRRLARDEKAAIKAQRSAEQAAIRTQIEAAGGAVIGSFQSAINGLKVRIAPSQIARLRGIPGVVGVKHLATYSRDNLASVQHAPAPFAWSGTAGTHGEGIKIAIIDSGIDYTHADFGGPGTPAAFKRAAAASTQPADPALFGPHAPKVKGGIDMVGDDYDSSAGGDAAVPRPDPNPLDCSGHGSHVAGAAAGFGVLADGTQFRGPYSAPGAPTASFAIPPGVAPLAELYAVRVFGCKGTSNVIVDAIEWAVDNEMDVINLSLGAAFGPGDAADAVAADAAVDAGAVVVASVGNDGDVPYIISAPAVSSKAISVAAAAQKPAASLDLPAGRGGPGQRVIAIDANAAPLAAAPLRTVVLRTGGDVSLGCDLAEFMAQDVAGKLVVVRRGDCGRVIKVLNGQLAGAAAVAMINTDKALPPFEGQITRVLDNGVPITITIPFLGVRGPADDPGSDGAALVLRDGAAIAIGRAAPVSPGAADFSSSGPRTGDAALKPELAAPGEDVVSVLIASGTQGIAQSGAGVAGAAVAGSAAIAIQAHPQWKPAAIKAALLGSARPDVFDNYVPRRVGGGMVSAAAAVATQAYAVAEPGDAALNFGVAELSADRTFRGSIAIRNDSAAAVTFQVAATAPQGSPHSVAFSASRITVPAHSEASLDVGVAVPATTIGSSESFHEVAGLITLTPDAGSNRNIALRVPYYLVPRVVTNIATELTPLSPDPFATAVIRNPGSVATGTADLYTWGLSSPDEGHGRVDLRAAGVQAFDVVEGRIVIFGINMHHAWSSPESQEVHVLVDSDGDGAPDFDVFTADSGLRTNGVRDGLVEAAILNLHTGDVTADFLIRAMTDTATIQLPVLAASIGITPEHPRLSYTASALDLWSRDRDAFTGVARFNAFHSAVSNAFFVTVPPDTLAAMPITVDFTELALTPAQGLMMISPDNKNGPDEAQLLPLITP